MKQILKNEIETEKDANTLFLETATKRATATIKRVDTTLNDTIILNLKDNFKTENNGILLVCAKVEISSQKAKDETLKTTGININDLIQKGNTAKDFLINQSLSNLLRKNAKTLIKE